MSTPEQRPAREPAPAAAAAVAHYLERSQAANTRRAYRSDWRDFEDWCRAHGHAALPAAPETLMLYATALADAVRPATIGRRMAAIAQVHRAARVDPPTLHLGVRKVLAGIRREKGTRPRGKQPLLAGQFRAMLAALPDGPAGARDRALLLTGFAGALRRGELTALDFEDVAFTPQGMKILVRRSKTDPEGAGQQKGIARGATTDTCPVLALRSWMELLGNPAGGPLFRPVDRHGRIGTGRLSDRAVALVVKRAAAGLGLDPSLFAGHSLRAGLATSAALAGKSERSIMNQTGHRSLTTVRRYIRDGDLFHDNASDGIGL